MDYRTWNGESVTIDIDYDRCDGNGKCVEVCPGEVFELQNNKSVPVNIDECIECCACVESCPQEAIRHSSCD